MICLCLGKPGEALSKEVLEGVALAEIRLDGAMLTPEEIRRIFSLPPALIATCRPRPGTFTDEQRKMTLLTAVVAGADYVDIEMEAGDEYKNELIQTARLQECRVIISYHNDECTPSKKQLEDIIEQCFSGGADLVKIACRVHSHSDAARILSLYDYPGRLHLGNLIALGMGEKGKITRVAAPLLGAPFTYASPAAGNETGPGQLEREALTSIYNLLNR
jgi:3-dehydroquinate dehydratase I